MPWDSPMVVFPSGDLKMVQLLVEGGANVFGNTKQGLPYYLTGTSQVGRFLLIEMPATELLDSVQIQVSGLRIPSFLIPSFLGIRKISLIQKQLRFFCALRRRGQVADHISRNISR